MKNSLRLLTLLFSVFLLSSCVSSPDAAYDINVSDDEVNKIASQLYCPICENVPLDVCPSTACADWRELIRKLMVEGKSEAEIKQYFAEQYGWKTLSMPPRVGFNWVLYVLPPVIIIGGGLFVAMSVQKKHYQQTNQIKPKQEKSNDDVVDFIDIIEKDLEEEDHAE